MCARCFLGGVLCGCVLTRSTTLSTAKHESECAGVYQHPGLHICWLWTSVAVTGALLYFPQHCAQLHTSTLAFMGT